MKFVRKASILMTTLCIDQFEAQYVLPRHSSWSSCSVTPPSSGQHLYFSVKQTIKGVAALKTNTGMIKHRVDDVDIVSSRWVTRFVLRTARLRKH